MHEEQSHNVSRNTAIDVSAMRYVNKRRLVLRASQASWNGAAKSTVCFAGRVLQRGYFERIGRGRRVATRARRVTGAEVPDRCYPSQSR